jgi:hypothetical protein
LRIAHLDCELVRRENGSEHRQPHTFHSDIQPGTALYLEAKDWIVIGMEERPTGLLPQVICRPASERI